MGYRSTMVLGVPKEKEKEFLNLDAVIENDFEIANCYANDVVVFRGEYLKWYDKYKDVQAIEKFLNDTWKEFPEKTFLIGVGEDGHIHSEIGAYYNYCGIYTDILIHE
jgi:RimJ/RimL family protein N-acetyltransferase